MSDLLTFILKGERMSSVSAIHPLLSRTTSCRFAEKIANSQEIAFLS